MKREQVPVRARHSAKQLAAREAPTEVHAHQVTNDVASDACLLAYVVPHRDHTQWGAEHHAETVGDDGARLPEGAATKLGGGTEPAEPP